MTPLLTMPCRTAAASAPELVVVGRRALTCTENLVLASLSRGTDKRGTNECDRHCSIQRS